MNPSDSMLLLGVGGAGAAIARGVSRAFGDGLRYLTVDTDATVGQSDGPFILLGGDRLSGRGAGGDIVAARLATDDSLAAIDDALEGVRLVVVTTGLGGGTGGGATLEIVKHLSDRGLPTVVFATLPFAFEGDDRQRNARGVTGMIEEAANATFFVPLDKLVGDTDNMDAALRHAVDTLSSGITFFWRLVGRPGYIRLGVEDLRHLLAGAGRARFATFTTQGADRARATVDAISRSEMLATGSSPVKTILCGILAGEDLRLSEIAVISDGVRTAFGQQRTFKLATVNDEGTFSGRLVTVIMLLEAAENGEESGGMTPAGARTKRPRTSSVQSAAGRGGRFSNAEQTIWHGEDIDMPTFIREGINLDY